ncbi:hypothetical protein B0H66DRAFT_602045 [Apodospora peruviana]|uniref:Uncharacterized protein n=1 Tax=Apodospora peruviana TaxID=516989 RepID=A0AAE0M8M0_9PEZI|nr:hypothetical protein B0H66DRAFT_602045 [Apodospora peruviana]
MAGQPNTEGSNQEYQIPLDWDKNLEELFGSPVVNYNDWKPKDPDFLRDETNPVGESKTNTTVQDEEDIYNATPIGSPSSRPNLAPLSDAPALQADPASVLNLALPSGGFTSRPQPTVATSSQPALSYPQPAPSTSIPTPDHKEVEVEGLDLHQLSDFERFLNENFAGLSDPPDTNQPDNQHTQQSITPAAAQGNSVNVPMQGAPLHQSNPERLSPPGLDLPNQPPSFGTYAALPPVTHHQQPTEQNYVYQQPHLGQQEHGFHQQQQDQSFYHHQQQQVASGYQSHQQQTIQSFQHPLGHQRPPVPPPQFPQLGYQLPSVAPPQLPVVANTKRIVQNRKKKNEPGNDPLIVYGRRQPRNDWGITQDGSPLFRYHQFGTELRPNLFLSKNELIQFMMGVGAQTPRNLRLWIQNSPAQVNWRYHSSSESSKCRWKDCPCPQKTILKGFWRVAFDEDSDGTSSGRHDPFLNAGYMHLYCFEKIFNLGFLTKLGTTWHFQVEADTRTLPHEERNPMSVTRDHSKLEDIWNSYRQKHANIYREFTTEWAQNNFERVYDMAFTPTTVPDDERLWRLLTEAHLAHEQKTRQESRIKRNSGSDISVHKGDLEVYVAAEALKKNSKRKRGEGDDGEEKGSVGEGCSSKQGSSCSPPRKIARPASPRVSTAGGGDADRPGTRQSSRNTQTDILEKFNTSSPITRSTTQTIHQQLNAAPAHVQRIVLAQVPAHLREIIDGVRREGEHYADGLEGRISRLPRRQRVEVDEFTRKREQTEDICRLWNSL